MWFNILKKFGHLAHNKVIPEFITNAPKDFIKEFLRGYIRSDPSGISADGCANKNKITTTSHSIAYSIQRLYLKLGKFASINYQKRPNTTIIEGRIVNQRNSYQIEVLINDPQKKQKSFIENNYAWFSLFDMTNETITNSIDVYNMEVDIDNSYCVDNIIVHNCQGFSMAGKRDTKDPRNSLFIEYVKYLNHFKPNAFLMENVKGILSMKTEKGEKVIDIILAELRVNYVCNYYALSSADFEVPQHRVRVIFIGFRKDLNIEPTIPDIVSKIHIPVKTILKKKEDVDKKYFLSQKAIDGINKKKKRMLAKNNGFGAQFLDPDKPSFTIPARYWKDGYDALVRYSDNDIRRLTIDELKKIQTFPTNYVFSGSDREIIIQIGNAVASNFAFHLGKYIINKLNSIKISENEITKQNSEKKNVVKEIVSVDIKTDKKNIKSASKK